MNRLARRSVAAAAAAAAVAASLTGAPQAVAVPGDPLSFVFARGGDGAVWYRTRSASGGWFAWRTLGGVSTGRPSAEVLPDGRLAVFVRGADGALWMRASAPGDDSSWSEWQTLGGVALDDPVAIAAAWEPGRFGAELTVAVRGADGRPWVRSFIGSNGPWTGWQTWGAIHQVTGVGQLRGHADAGHFFLSGLAARPGVGFIAEVEQGGFPWVSRPTPGEFLDAPAVLGPEEDLVAVGRRSDEQLGLWFTGDSDFEPLGGTITHAPVFGPGATVLARGADAAPWSWSAENGSWTRIGGGSSKVRSAST